MNNLKDYIIVVKNAITYPLCDAILKEYENKEEWIDATIAMGNIDANIRNCKTIGLSFNSIIDKNKKIRFKLDKYIFASASKCIKEYNLRFPLCKIEQDSGYDLLKYEEGNFYIEHTDSFKSQPRSVSCSFALNDNFDGGEFAFFNRQLKYKLEKGDALMFPSNFMYPHEILPVIKGTRYSIVTWFI